MKFLVVADVHGEYEKLSYLLGKIDFDFDVVICPGDFSDIGLVARGFEPIDLVQLVLDELKNLGKPLFVVPGNHDLPESLEIFNEYGTNLHGIGKKISSEIGICGWGGAKTPFNTPFEPSEKETEMGLKNGWEMIKDSAIKILVTHNPAKNTKLDVVSSGAHVGSGAIRKFIEENQPHIAISAHIHEAKGLDVIGKTKLIYPGPVMNGFIGIIEVGKEIKMNILNMF